MLILFTSALVWAVLSYAETYCVSTTTVPPLASCDRVLTRIEGFVTRAGRWERTFGPSESKATITLPIWFADNRYDGEGGSCSALLLWNPRLGSDRPANPPWNFDAFLAVEVLRAAVRIRDACVQVGKLGEEWIKPDQWVQVRFVISFPSNITGIDGGLSIGTTNGTNMTVVDGGNLIKTVPDLELILTGIATVSKSTATEVVAA